MHVLPAGKTAEPGSWNFQRDGAENIPDHKLDGRSNAALQGIALYCPSMKELHCIVRGRVQMVMYRDFATRNARRLGLAGYAKNLKDGTVEVLAQGPQDKLEALLARLRKGSFLSRVDAVDASWREPGQAYGDFRIAW